MGGVSAENFMCCLLAENRKLALNAYNPAKFGACIKNRAIQELSRRTMQGILQEQSCAFQCTAKGIRTFV